jgi:hypothetical protein
MPNSQSVTRAFEREICVLPIDSITSQRTIAAASRKCPTYREIAASLRHVGLIEPVVVFRRGPGDYLLLDGHLRLDILKQTGATEVRAVIATDDEAYTYNKRVNHAPPIAQHSMILKAIANGVSEEQIAAALNVDVQMIKQKRDLLDGICPESASILRDSRVSMGAFAVLKKMKPIRQIEVAEHLHATCTFSGSFARSLLAVTRPEFLLHPEKARKLEAKSAAARAMFEEENATLAADFKKIEESFGADMLLLSVSCAYVRRLLSNQKIERHLEKYHPDVLSTLRMLVSETAAKPQESLAIAG